MLDEPMIGHGRDHYSLALLGPFLLSTSCMEAAQDSMVIMVVVIEALVVKAECVILPFRNPLTLKCCRNREDNDRTMGLTT